MSEEILARQFEEHREHLRAVGFRMLGSTAEADDAVQETWLRLARVDSNEILNLAGWLTTALSRVCLDMLRSRGSRREVTLDEPGRPDPADAAIGPETEAVLADSIGVALLVVLDTLTPAERLTFVLHDLFAVPFDEIAPIVDRSPAAARQLASRARRRVQGGGVAEPDAPRRRRVVEAFLAVVLFSGAVFVFQQSLPEFFHSDYLYAWFVFFAFDNFERKSFGDFFNLFVSAADQTLGGKDGVFGICDRLSFGRHADNPLVVFDGDHGWGCAAAFGIWDNFRFTAFHNGHAGVGCAEVNADDFGHNLE